MIASIGSLKSKTEIAPAAAVKPTSKISDRMNQEIMAQAAPVINDGKNPM
jgi:hypothetical protein